MQAIAVDPTSADSAACDPIILRQTDTVRLLFRPTLVNSVHDKKYAVRGVFAYQRKRKADQWEDVDAVSLAKLKGGEGVRLEMDTQEVYNLVTTLGTLYEFHAKHGIPKTKVVALAGTGAAGGLSQEQLEAFGEALQAMGPADLEKVLEWAAQTANRQQVVEQLKRLDVDSLQKLNTLIGVSTLKNVLDLWHGNQGNSEEEF